MQVRSDWRVIEEMDFPRLLKLNLPGVGSGEEIDGHQYGTLHFYDKVGKCIWKVSDLILSNIFFNDSFYLIEHKALQRLLIDVSIFLEGKKLNLNHFQAIDRVNVKNPIQLQRCGGSFYNVTTTGEYSKVG